LALSPVEDPEEPSLEVPVDPVDAVEVEVVSTDAFSALVSAGGVMSGVLFGTTSEALLVPPHAPSVVPARSTNDAPTATRAGKVRLVRAVNDPPASGW
jgi:hypothetical protein